MGEASCEALMTENVGLIQFFRGELEDAERSLRDALALAQEADDAAEVASALRSLARIRLGAGDPETARPLIAESLELSLTVGDRRGSAIALDRAAQLAAAEGRRERAAFLLGVADALHAAIGAPRQPQEDVEYNATRAAIAGAEAEYLQGLASDPDRAMALVRTA
jgi:tetratricopeptide (TPR) repeat protein